MLFLWGWWLLIWSGQSFLLPRTYRIDFLSSILSVQNCLIRVSPRGREALVADFGLAREVADLPVNDPHRKLSLVGSAFWMAPEMLRGEPYDRKVKTPLLKLPSLPQKNNHSPFQRPPSSNCHLFSKETPLLKLPSLPQKNNHSPLQRPPSSNCHLFLKRTTTHLYRDPPPQTAISSSKEQPLTFTKTPLLKLPSLPQRDNHSPLQTSLSTPQYRQWK